MNSNKPFLHVMGDMALGLWPYSRLEFIDRHTVLVLSIICRRRRTRLLRVAGGMHHNDIFALDPRSFALAELRLVTGLSTFGRVVPSPRLVSEFTAGAAFMLGFLKLDACVRRTLGKM